MDRGYVSPVGPGYGSGPLHIEPQRSAMCRMKHEVGYAFYMCIYIYIDYREREGVSVCVCV